MPLSEDEQRILHQIEQQFYASDPAFADELENHSVYAHCLRQMRWAGVAFVAGLVVLIAALITNTSFLVAFLGFVLMLVATLWFERSFRKMGRAGMQQLSALAQGRQRPRVPRQPLQEGAGPVQARRRVTRPSPHGVVADDPRPGAVSSRRGQLGGPAAQRPPAVHQAGRGLVVGRRLGHRAAQGTAEREASPEPPVQRHVGAGGPVELRPAPHGPVSTSSSGGSAPDQDAAALSRASSSSPSACVAEQRRDAVGELRVGLVRAGLGAGDRGHGVDRIGPLHGDAVGVRVRPMGSAATPHRRSDDHDRDPGEHRQRREAEHDADGHPASVVGRRVRRRAGSRPGSAPRRSRRRTAGTWSGSPRCRGPWRERWWS